MGIPPFSIPFVVILFFHSLVLIFTFTCANARHDEMHSLYALLQFPFITHTHTQPPLSSAFYKNTLFRIYTFFLFLFRSCSLYIR